MKYLYRMIGSFLLAALSLYLVVTVFAKSLWEGPLLISLFICCVIYGCWMLHKWKPSIAKVVFELIGNFLTLP